jgi:HAD superfamily hydrolase (TIGR01484 family)
MKKLVAFDLDGTLAPSKSQLPDEIGEQLSLLLIHKQVCVISGGKFEQFEKQILNNLNIEAKLLTNLHLMPTCGTRYYRFNLKNSSWQKIYSEDFSADQKKKIVDVLTQTLSELNLVELNTYGEIIEDRGSQITLSVLGQDIVDVLGLKGVEIKEHWDPDNKKKNLIAKTASPRLSEFEVRVGGLTSIDVTKPGIDKAYGMKKLINELKIDKSEILFLGDRLQPGGNDYPVKEMGINLVYK